MNIDTVRSTLTTVINDKKAAFGVTETQSLTQEQLTELTDALAANGLETVNPNGPGYPSTPK